MKNDNPTTSVSIGSVLGEVIDHYGLDKNDIAKQAGIDTNVAYGSSDRISAEKIQKVWRAVKELTGDDCVGLTYAKFIQPSSLNGLGLAWITSDSLADSIKRLIRFQHSISTAIDFTLNEIDAGYQILLRSKIKNAVDISIDASVASLLRMCRITYGPELEVERVSFSHTQPNCVEEFKEYFGIPVEFDASETMIVFPKDAFEKILVTANPELARMNDLVVIEYLKKYDKENVSLQVRAQIIENLNSGVPDQEKIARVLSMSLRNLQRKLRSEGTSYNILLDETRSELSRQYLRGSNRSIFEVAYLLGFSDSSNFSRAFRRWVGMSPQEFRQSPYAN